jgi:hypothetical protein
MPQSAGSPVPPSDIAANRRTAMGIGRNDIGETCSAAAFDGEIPQERAQAGRQLLDGSIAAMVRAFQEKAPNSGRFPPFWVVAERIDQSEMLLFSIY